LLVRHEGWRRRGQGQEWRRNSRRFRQQDGREERRQEEQQKEVAEGSGFQAPKTELLPTRGSNRVITLN
jgi:hypothetical protein